MSRLLSRMTTFQLAATVSLSAVSAVLAQDASPTTLDTITVQAETEKGDGPVEGYVASRSRAGTKTDTPLIRTPQAVSVVPSRQIEDQAADSVAQAVRYTAGVAGEYRGASNLHDELYIRGFGYVPRYVNGLEFGDSSLGQIAPYLLERVEVLKGPSSILYGQASPGGIINLATKRATGETRREVELVTGLDARLGVNADLGGTIDQAGVWSYRLVGTAERYDLEEDDLSKEGFAVAPSLTYAPSEDTALTLLAMFSHDPKGGFRNFREASGTLYATPHGFIPNSFNVSDPDFEEYRRTQAQIGYSFEHRFNEVFQVRQNVAYNIIDTYHQTLTWGTLDSTTDIISRTPSGGSSDLNQFVVDNQIQSDFATGAFTHTLLTGLDYKRSKQNYQWGFGSSAGLGINWRNPTYGNLPAIALDQRVTDRETTAWQLGLYAQDQIEVGNLTVSLGGRYDWAGTEIDNASGADTSYDDSAFSGRAGAIYNFDNGIAPFVSYSTSFEPALSVDHNGEMLDPVTAQQWEGGVKYASADGRFQVYASVFHILQQNMSSTDPVTRNITQTGEIRSQGFEVEGHAEVTENFSLTGSYTYIDTQVTKDENPARIGLKVDRRPEHMANIWGTYAFTDGPLNGVGVGLGVRHIGPSTDRGNSLDVPAATLLDAMASYDFGAASGAMDGVKLQVNASNLLDDRYTASCASAFACWYGPGRTVTAKLKYTW